MQQDDESGLGRLVGRRLGNWELTRLLGEGGFGAVYEARNPFIQARAAIKVLHPELGQNPQLRTRFLNEAMAANAAKHPNIVQVTDGGEAEGLLYLVLEFLEGRTLTAELRKGRMDERRAITVAIDVAAALDAAHRVGVFHRDVKPDNVYLLDAGDQVKVLDFGIAKLADNVSSLKTRTGQPMGTPAYMSPEQWRAERDLDGRTDIYSLGIMLFEMVAGVRPLEADSLAGWVQAHLMAPRPDPAQLVGVSRGYADLVLSMMAVERDARPRTMGDVVAALRALASGHPLAPAAPSPISSPQPPQAPAWRTPTGPQHTPAATGQLVPPGAAPTPQVPPIAAPPAAAPSGMPRWVWPALAVVAIGAGGLAYPFLHGAKSDDAPPKKSPQVAQPADPPTEPKPAQPTVAVAPTPPKIAFEDAPVEGASVHDKAAPAPPTSTPGFTVEIDGKTELREGELAHLTLRSPRDAQLLVVLIEQYGAGEVVMPSGGEHPRVRADKPFAFPTFKATLRHAGESSKERLVVYAITDEGDYARLSDLIGRVQDATKTADPVVNERIARLTAAVEQLPSDHWGRGELAYEIAPRSASGGGASSTKSKAPAGNPTVRGSLDREAVRGVIARHLSEVRFCYQRRLADKPDLAGRLTLQFTISATGAVAAATVASSTLADPTVEQCIVNRVRSWEFPQPRGGGIAVISYPFVLQPS